MNKKLAIKALSLKVVFVILLTVCNVFAMGSRESTKNVKVRIGYQPTVVYSYLFLAEREGMFDKAKLDVEFFKIPSANKIFQAYLAGQLDMTGLTATEIMFRGYEKFPGTFVCPVMVELNGDDIIDRVIVMNDSPIKTVADLKGKTIGSHPGTTVPNIMNALLLKNGVKPNEVTIRTLKPNLQVNSLLSGAVDALICLEPSGSLSLATGKCRVLYDHPFNAIEEAFPASFSVLSKEFINKNPEAAKRLLTVIREAVERYNAEKKKNKKYLDKIVIDQFGLDPKVASMINVVTYRLPEEWDQENFKRIVDFYMGMDILHKPLTLDAIKP